MSVPEDAHPGDYGGSNKRRRDVTMDGARPPSGVPLVAEVWEAILKVYLPVSDGVELSGSCRSLLALRGSVPVHKLAVRASSSAQKVPNLAAFLGRFPAVEELLLTGLTSVQVGGLVAWALRPGNLSALHTLRLGWAPGNTGLECWDAVALLLRMGACPRLQALKLTEAPAPATTADYVLVGSLLSSAVSARPATVDAPPPPPPLGGGGRGGGGGGGGRRGDNRRGAAPPPTAAGVAGRGGGGGEKSRQQLLRSLVLRPGVLEGFLTPHVEALALRGVSDAVCELGKRHEERRHRNFLGTVDLGLAAELYAQAMDLGSTGGAYRLGLLLLRSGEVGKAAGALEWAGRRGNPYAQMQMAKICLASGRRGEATRWLSLAAHTGLPCIFGVP